MYILIHILRYKEHPSLYRASSVSWFIETTIGVVKSKGIYRVISDRFSSTERDLFSDAYTGMDLQRLRALLAETHLYVS
jgi:hypothetical protein